MFLLGYAFGLLVILQTRLSCSAHGFLKCYIGLWLTYSGLVLVCLIQSLTYMLWMEKKKDNHILIKM